jgi:hypothetical protein
MIHVQTSTPFDRFGKQMIRAALAGRGAVETDAEVPADTRRVDLWFMPGPIRDPVPDSLGLLGRMTAGPSTFELFHCTPSGDDLADCLIKHGQFRHYLSLRTPPPPIPIQWVISSGHPESGIRRLWFRPMSDWPPGIYEGPPLLWTRLVVVSELPVARSTLLLRLLGAGRVLKQAIAELKALQAEEPERRLALPILVGLRLEVPINPSKRTTEDQEFLMETQDLVENWRREAIQEGFIEGERAALLRQLRHRFGDEVDTTIEQRVATASGEQIEAWSVRVLSAATLAELFSH